MIPWLILFAKQANDDGRLSPKLMRGARAGLRGLEVRGLHAGRDAITPWVRSELRRIVDGMTISEEMREVMDAVIEHGLGGMHARELAAALGVSETTLNSRFARAGVPSPRRLLVTVRLIFIARLAAEGCAPESIAYYCGLSSAPALYRHIRNERGISPTELGQQAAREWEAFRLMFGSYRWPEYPLTGSRTGVAA